MGRGHGRGKRGHHTGRQRQAAQPLNRMAYQAQAEERLTTVEQLRAEADGEVRDGRDGETAARSVRTDT